MWGANKGGARCPQRAFWTPAGLKIAGRTARSTGRGLLAFCLSVGALHAAKVEVHGMGFVGDRELNVALARLLAARQRDTLDANAIEDAAVIVHSTLADEGFESPVITIEVELAKGGGEKQF